MHYTVGKVTRQDYQAIKSLTPADPQTLISQVHHGERIQYTPVRMFRLTETKWKLLTIHEETASEKPYKFVVTLLLRCSLGGITVMQLHFNAWIPSLLLGRYDSSTNTTVSPYTFFEFPTTINSASSTLLQHYVKLIPAETIYVDET